MECEVFLADSRSALAAGRVQRRIVEVPPLDVDTMRQSYYSKKGALQQGFEQFRARWEAEWHTLPHPQAGLIRWDHRELQQEFPADSTLGEQSPEQLCDCGYAAVWTIGPELERTSSEEVRGSTLLAMFLDVAGSLTMGQIRRALYSFAAGLGSGHAILGEHVPEIQEGDPRLKAIVSPWQSAPEGLRPEFRMNENGVLQPLKSQCAMLYVGEPREGLQVHLDEIPCSHCKGSKCLYRQFGGCHLPIDHQPGEPEPGAVK